MMKKKDKMKSQRTSACNTAKTTYIKWLTTKWGGEKAV